VWQLKTDKIVRPTDSGRIVLLLRNLIIAVAVATISHLLCAPSRAQDLFDAPAPPDIVPMSEADEANLEGCQVIARIDDQIVLACDVLWRVNQLLEAHLQRMPPDQQVSPEQIDAVRQQLMKREVAAMVDRKLLFNEFRRTVPPENLSRIDENLQEPFDEHELPELMKLLKVDNQRDLERELARLGSSLADARQAFNERVVASEWIRSKVKINDEVSPDEMLEYYQAHLSEYDYPTQARWEELMVRKRRFKDAADAYAELARLGNEVWQRRTAQPVRGVAFADLAKTKSDGFTAKDGGLHDWTTKGSLQCAAIDEALFTLQVGQLSPILESNDGFHIVRVLERKEAGRKPFTDMQVEIREKLKKQRFNKGVEEYLVKLRQDARIWTVFTGNVSADALLGRKPDESQTR